MKVLLINAHHEHPGWSPGLLNAAAFQVAKDVFTARGDEALSWHQRFLETGTMLNG